MFKKRSVHRRIGWGTGLALVACFVGCRDEPAKPPAPPAAPHTAPSPATTQSAQAVTSYLQVVRSTHPQAATQPLATQVTLSEAARVRLDEPVHLDAQGHLWITHQDGEPLEAALAEAAPSSALAATPSAGGNDHVVRERILCVAWLMNRQNDPQPHAVVERGGRHELVSAAAGRRGIGSRADYRWDRARVWEDGDFHRLIVPTVGGMSVFTIPVPRGDIVESHLSLGDSSTPPMDANDPQFVYDPQGIIAWLPADGPGAGGGGAARYVEGVWRRLSNADGFPPRISHLIPYPDGSVTVLSPATDGKLAMGLASLRPSSIAPAALTALAARLADDTTRDAALSKLNAMGPGVWPALARLDTLAPKTREAVADEIQKRAAGLLGMRVDGAGASIAARLRDGGVVIHAPAGAAFIRRGDGTTTGPRVIPAWVVARPGMAAYLLAGPLVADLKPGRSKLDLVGERWIAATDGFGPRLFLHNAFRRLLKKDERSFSQVVGVDRRGRWLFHQDAPAGQPIGPTLIIDPTLPGFEPRLPAWTIVFGAEFGWDKDNWPALRTDGGSRLRLGPAGWQAMGDDEPLLIDPLNTPPLAPPASPKPNAASQPATRPASRPASQPATAPSPQRLAELGKPLWTDADGTRYFDGVDTLVILTPDGVETTWILPSEAAGFSPPAFLLRAGADRLYLVNQPGRVLLLKATPGESEPMAVEAAFTKGLPADDAPIRVWPDPAGRLVIQLSRKLVILFPEGFIPRSIRDLMADADDDGVTPVEPDGEIF